MAVTLQKGLELALGLPKAQPPLQRLHILERPKKRHLLQNAVLASAIAAQLQRLHIVEQPKKRHRLRNVVFVGSTIASGAIVAAVLCRRRGWCKGAVAGDEGDAQASSPEPKTPEVEPDWNGPSTDVDAPQEIKIPAPA